jgi:Dolichyl-phosphate-mannose-protein mannosyltransferase
MKGLVSRFDTRAQIGLLALLALYFLVWPVWRAQFPIEIAQNEGWNAYHADAAVGGGALYPSPDTLIVNNYPPLSFYVIGWLGNLFGDPLYVGRVLSLIATLGLGVLIARVVRQLGSGQAGAAVAGIWFVATMARSYNRFVGMNDPQLAGQLVMVAALSWFLARDKDGRSSEPPILLMVLAGFWKHNIIAVPATVLAWLWLRDGRRALRPTVVGVAAALVGLAICVAVYGDVFLANLLTPRPTRLMRAISGIGRSQWILPALAIWAIWAWSERKIFAARFTALYVGIAFAAYLAQWTGEDILDNAQFDLVIATAIGLGVAFDRAAATAFARRFGVETARATVVLILVLRLVATARGEPFLILFDPGYRAEFYAHAQVARDEAARVAAIPGPVACDLKVVCRMARKPFVYDDFRADMLIMTGAAKGLDDKGLMRQHGLTYFQNDPRAGIESLHRAWIGKP